MADVFDPKKRSWIMSQVHSRGTRPEQVVGAALKERHIRHQEHRRDLPGCPDFAFPNLKLALFVNGCFWHWHGCKRSRMPASNEEYWQKKIQRNIQRDKAKRRELHAKGWRYMTIWECNLESGIRRCIRELQQTIRRER